MNRTYFTFKDDNLTIGHNLEWFTYYYRYASLYNRLLSEKYHSKYPELLNFDFCTEEYFKVRGFDKPLLYRNKGKDWAMYINYDIIQFEKMQTTERIKFIWESVWDIIKQACLNAHNYELLYAAEYAYLMGLKLNWKTDYIYLSKEIILFDKKITAVVHMKFEDADLVAVLEVYKDSILIFDSEIARAYVALDIFRDMIKDIEVDHKQQIVVKMKGAKSRKFEVKIDFPH